MVEDGFLFPNMLFSCMDLHWWKLFPPWWLVQQGRLVPWQTKGFSHRGNKIFQGAHLNPLLMIIDSYLHNHHDVKCYANNYFHWKQNYMSPKKNKIAPSLWSKQETFMYDTRIPSLFASHTPFENSYHIYACSCCQKTSNNLLLIAVSVLYHGWNERLTWKHFFGWCRTCNPKASRWYRI